MADDYCPNHPKITSEIKCTKFNVVVCSVCQIHHKTCQAQHISLQQARSQVSNGIPILKIEMTNLLEKAKKVHETLTDVPNDLCLRKEEVLLDISQHFADIKTNILKSLIVKEQEMITKLTEVLKEEKNWTGEALDENLTITEGCVENIKFLDEQVEVTNTSFKEIARIRSMEELVLKFKSDLSRLELESDIKQIKYVPKNLDELSFGNIRSPHTFTEGTEVVENLNVNVSPASTSVFQNVSPASTSVFQNVPQPLIVPPILVDEQGKPTWDLARYSTSITNQIPILAPFTKALETSSTHEYPGRVIRLPGPQLSRKEVEEKRKKSDRLYLETHGKGKHTDPGNVEQLTLTAEVVCRHRQDTRQCKFVGITSIAEDLFIVVDRWNKNLKLVKLKGPVVKLLPLKHNQEPWDATRVLSSQHNEIAVTFPSICSIIFVQHEYGGKTSKLEVGNEITTNVGYGSLGCINHEQLVCGVFNPFGPPRIDIISMKGDILRQFENVVTYPRSIDTSPGHVIAISDWTQRKVLFLREDGQLINTFGGHGDFQPKGIAYYEDGSFLVVDQKTGCLYKIDESGLLETTFKIKDNASVVACVPTSSRFSKEGLAVMVATDEGAVKVYDATQFQKELGESKVSPI